MREKIKGLLVRAAWWFVRRLGLHLSCPDHPTYHGLRQRPRGECVTCALIHRAVR